MGRITYEEKKELVLKSVTNEELSTSELAFQTGFNYYITEEILDKLQVLGLVHKNIKRAGVFWRKSQ